MSMALKQQNKQQNTESKESYYSQTLNIFGFEYEYRTIELFIYSSLAFIIPFMLPHPQILTGSVVNGTIILSAIRFKNLKQTLPVILLPSIAALTHGLLFGPFTIFLIYFIPFVWLGNSILAYGMIELFLKRRINYFISLIISAAAKSLLLFSSAYLLVNLSVVPSLFLTAMGIVQLSTALLGGVIVGFLGALKAKFNPPAY